MSRPLPATYKEVRALAPAWGVAVGAVVVSRLVGTAIRADLGLGAYLAGVAALGGLSIGQEFSDGTLATLLVEPRRRQAVLLTKLGVLGAAVVLFVAVAYAVLAAGAVPPTWPMVVLPALCAVCVAPWLTMTFRHAVAGGVFAAIVPGLWWVVGRLVGLVVGSASADDVTLMTTLGGTAAVCLVAAVLGWRRFMHLEVLESGVGDLAIFGSRALAAPPARRRLPVWLLLKKELHLQQMAVAAAGLYVTMWAMVLVVDHRLTDRQQTFYVMSVFYIPLTALLIGAVASADERRLGTLEWQLLLPVAAWRQWLVKIAVAFGLSVVLAAGLPFALAWLSPPSSFAVDQSLVTGASIGVLGLTFAALYASSLARSGLWALLLSVLFAPLGMALSTAYRAVRLGYPGAAAMRVINVLELFTLPYRLLFGGLTKNSFSPRASAALVAVWQHQWLALAGIIVAAVVILRGALENHRIADRQARRLWRQVGIVALTAIVTVNAYDCEGWLALRSEFDPAARARASDIFSGDYARSGRWRQDLVRLTTGFHGRVGVCVMGGLSRACLRGDERFPMQSVWKLPLAMTVLDAVDRGVWHLTDPVVVHREDLSVYTEPLAKLVGPSGFHTTIDDLLRRTIVDSDNAAADILVRRLGGPAVVQKFIDQQYVMKGIRVDRDERQLQSDFNGLTWRPEFVDPSAFARAVDAVPEARRDAAFRAYLDDPRDTATPLAMVQLLSDLAYHGILFRTSVDHLLDLLTESQAQPDRLKAGVTDGWTIGHKPGTSMDWHGETGATNDVGFLRPPGPLTGALAIAVFISGSHEPPAARAKLMADIVRAIIADPPPRIMTPRK